MAAFRRVFALLCLLAILLQGPAFPAQAQSPVGDVPFPGGKAPITTLGSPINGDDTHFVADSGDDLDQYLFRADRSDGRLKFNIQLTRYYFNTSDANNNIHFDSNGFLTPTSVTHIINKKILPATVKLRMRVYDVDEDAQGCSEVDLIYVNGEPLTKNNQQARLSGANDTWSVVSYDVPISLLKLPQGKGNYSSPAPVSNEIAIEIDVNCITSWAVEVDYGILEIMGPVRPIVFAHGWTGKTDTFDKIEKERMLSDGIPSAGQADLDEGITPISEEASILSNYIRNAAMEYGVNKINLFAHSKGGLVSRWALYDPGTAGMVEHLVTFDSPHHGTVWADNEWLMEKICEWNKYPNDPAKATLCFEATKEFSTESVRNTFNYRGCTHNFFTGWSNCQPIYVRQPAVDYRAFSAIGDPIVGPKSSTQYPWNADQAPMPSWTWINVDAKYTDSHGGILERQDSYQCAIHLLDSSRYSCPGTNSSAASQEQDQIFTAANITADQVISTQSGSLAGPGLFTANVSVDGGTQLILEVYTGGGLDFTLLEPGGRLITPDVASTDPLIEYTSGVDLGLYHYSYIISNPVIGIWETRIQSGAAANFTIVGLTDSPTVLELAANKASYIPGETVTVQTALVQSGVAHTGSTISGEFEQPNGTFAPLTFYDNGTNGDPIANDGIYTSQFIAPSTQANLYINVVAEQGSIHREKSTLIPVSSQTAVINGVTGEWTVDEDGDGLIDWLMIQANINVLQTGYFDLQSNLVDVNGDFVQSAQFLSRSQNTVPLTVGIHSVVLQFSGQTFWDSGKNGPYTLTGLLLNDTTNQIFQVDSANNLYATASYTRDQFEHEAVWFESGSETATDQDFNGRYDFLTFHLQFGILPTGNYVVNGRLLDQNGNEIAWSETNFYVSSSGAYLVDLPFIGSEIGEHQQDGPYFLKDVSVYNQEGTAAIYFDSLGTTNSYRFTQFENGFYRVYLPLVARNVETTPSGQGINGRVTYQGNPIGGVTIELGFYNGSSYSTIRTTTTQANGDYQFTDAPSLGAGQRYYVRYWNGTNSTYVAYCGGTSLTSYTAGNAVAGGSFDIANIPQVSPPNGAVLALPYTFQWTPRSGVPSDNYILEIWDNNDWWETDPPVGYVTQYTVNSLPVGLSLGTQYVWDLAVIGADGSYCYSFDQNRAVTFSSGVASPQGTTIKKLRRPHNEDIQLP